MSQSRRVSTNSAERRLLITKAIVKDILSHSHSQSASESEPASVPWWKRYFGCFSRSCRRRRSPHSPPHTSTSGGKRTKTRHKYRRMNSHSRSKSRSNQS